MPITKPIQDKLRQLFADNGVKAGTKAALKYEYFFLQGVYAERGGDINPAVVVCLMAGRSILTLNLEERDNATAG